jgi:hypothetical protein
LNKIVSLSRNHQSEIRFNEKQNENSCPKKWVVYITASFPMNPPDGKLLVDILTRTCPSTIIFARSDALLPWSGAPVKL